MKGKDVAEANPKFKIGGYTYTFELNPRLIASQGLWGQCNHVDRLLRMDATISTREFLSVLIHEIFEAVKANRELDLPHATLANLEDAIFMVLADNPKTFVELLTNLD